MGRSAVRVVDERGMDGTAAYMAGNFRDCDLVGTRHSRRSACLHGRSPGNNERTRHMNCCGSARSGSSNFPSKPLTRAMVLLEYTGKTALSIVGPGSRIEYRFDRTGARALVDRRDVIYFAQVPVLRQIG
jgi:hypothetical protein